MKIMAQMDKLKGGSHTPVYAVQWKRKGGKREKKEQQVFLCAVGSNGQFESVDTVHQPTPVATAIARLAFGR